MSYRPKSRKQERRVRLLHERMLIPSVGTIECFADGRDEASASLFGIFQRCDEGCWHKLDPSSETDWEDFPKVCWLAYHAYQRLWAEVSMPPGFFDAQ